MKANIKTLSHSLRLFAIRHEERPVALVTLVVFAILNILQVMTHWQVYNKAEHVGFYTLYSRIFRLSGYDAWSCALLSDGSIYFDTKRHPLFLTVLYPLRWINDWVMQTFHLSIAMPLMATVLTILAVYTAVLFFRTLHDILQLPKSDAGLLTLLLFAFGHVMLPFVCPDHFAFSMFLLVLTIYLSGKALKAHRSLGNVKTALLLFFTAGISLSNGAKTVLAAVYTWGKGEQRSVKRLVKLSLSGLIALMVLGAVYTVNYYTLEKPDLEARQQRNRHMEEVQRQRGNTAFFERQANRQKWLAQHQNKTAGNGLITGLIDTSTPRPESLWHNFFGESLQLHSDHAFADMNFNRPLFVHYQYPWQYAIEVVLILLLVAGIIAGRRQPLMQMLLCWWAVDWIIHIVLGFALNEVYIMTSGWAFILPVAIACLLQRLQGRWLTILRCVVTFLAIYLLWYNATLLSRHLIAMA